MSRTIKMKPFDPDKSPYKLLSNDKLIEIYNNLVNIQDIHTINKTTIQAVRQELYERNVVDSLETTDFI